MPPAFSSIRFHRQILCSLCLALYLPACTTWQILPSTQLAPGSETPRRLRITLKTGEQFELDNARATADSLIGQRTMGDGETRSVRAAVAIADIQRVEDRRSNGGPGLILIVGGLLLFGLIQFGRGVFAGY